MISHSPRRDPQARAINLMPVFRQFRGPYPIFQLDARLAGTAVSAISPERRSCGIINMVFVKGSKETALTEPSGISYAIPIQHLKDLLERSR